MQDVEIKQSAIGQAGVFCTVAVPEGTPIREISYVREVTADAPLSSGEHPHHCTSIDGRLFLVGEPDRYFNHSCNPNVYLRFESDRTVVVARRPIEAGSELTLDYLINNSGGDSWPCRCGTSRCRGKTGYSFFTLPEPIQQEYAPLLAPWFRRRHHEELASSGLLSD